MYGDMRRRRIVRQTKDPCPTCHSYGRVEGIVGKRGIARSGTRRLPMSWPTRDVRGGWSGKRLWTIRYCPDIYHTYQDGDRAYAAWLSDQIHGSTYNKSYGRY